jgi:hypothetical protein
MIPPRLPDWQIEWIDRGREPKHPPDPKYPNGIDIDISRGADPACKSSLVHPAPRCGYYRVRCRSCGANAVITTAGRRDDPRSLKMACKLY